LKSVEFQRFDLQLKKIPPQKSGAVFLCGKVRLIGKVFQIQCDRHFYNSFGFCFCQFANCRSNRKIMIHRDAAAWFFRGAC
jgi:hypothetical protein